MNIKKSVVEVFGVFSDNDMLDVQASVEACQKVFNDYASTVEPIIEAEKTLIVEALNCYFDKKNDGTFVAQAAVVGPIVSDIIHDHLDIYDATKDYVRLSEHVDKVIKCLVRKGTLAIKKGAGIARV